MRNRFVWIFHGMGGRFSSAVFESEDMAKEWIEKNRLQGVLTKYPLNISVYDWAIEEGFFTPKDQKHFGSEFIQQFTSASQEHHHYEDD